MQSDVLQEVERAAIDHFGGPPPTRASVSFVGVEPIEVLRFADGPLGSGDARGSTIALLTLGMSRRPMGDAVDDPRATGVRAELVTWLHAGARGGGELWRRLAVLAAAPVVEGVIYSSGMSVDLGEPLTAGSICTGGLIAESDLASVPTGAGAVTILRFVPATSSELAFSRVHGSAALRERWQLAATDLLELSRPQVALG